MQGNCKSRNFVALMATQFLGAFNDNLYKTLVALIIVRLVIETSGSSILLSLSAALFVLPFIIFSPYAGYLGDRWRKSTIIQITKVLEIIVMSLGLFFFVYPSTYGMLSVVFLMGFQSTLFSPCKYGILPEILSEDQLSNGNGYLNFWSYLAILLGTASAGFIMKLSEERYSVQGVIVLSIAIAGYLASLQIKTVRTSNKRPFEINPFKDLWKSFQEMSNYAGLVAISLFIAAFWSYGALVQLNIFLYAKELLNVDDLGTAILVTTLALGIGIGSILAGKASGKNVELGFVTKGAIGIGLFSFVIGFTHSSVELTLLSLLALGVSGGFFIVPLHAALQQKSPEEVRARFIAANNFVVMLSVFIASAALTLFRDTLALGPAELFIALGFAALLVAIASKRTLLN